MRSEFPKRATKEDISRGHSWKIALKQWNFNTTEVSRARNIFETFTKEAARKTSITEALRLIAEEKREEREQRDEQKNMGRQGHEGSDTAMTEGETAVVQTDESSNPPQMDAPVLGTNTASALDHDATLPTGNGIAPDVLDTATGISDVQENADAMDEALITNKEKLAFSKFVKSIGDYARAKYVFETEGRICK